MSSSSSSSLASSRHSASHSHTHSQHHRSYSNSPSSSSSHSHSRASSHQSKDSDRASAELVPMEESMKQHKAKKAYYQGDAAESIVIHDAARGNAKEKHKRGGDYLKSIIYGGLDGIITTFAVVAGAAGADLGVGVILVMGFSNLIADGLSMGMGDFLSSKAEHDYAKAEKQRETWEFENYPEGEMAEMVEIYESKGMNKEDATKVIELLSKYKGIFINTMMVEELGLLPPDPSDSPLKNGLVTFASFFVCGLVPLIAYIFARLAAESVDDQFALLFGIACSMTALALFALGALSSRFTILPWWKSGLFYFGIGALAAASSYFVGWGVGELVKGGFHSPLNSHSVTGLDGTPVPTPPSRNDTIPSPTG